jgi:hypothetical protein
MARRHKSECGALQRCHDFREHLKPLRLDEGAGQKSFFDLTTVLFFELDNVYLHRQYWFVMQTASKSTAGESREQIIARIASIATMQPGTLTEEYRQGAIGEDGKPVRLGPYFKLQVWRDGANRSSRVPASQAEFWREDIDNYHTFDQLCGQLAELNIEHTRALRAAQMPAADPGESKKNSTRKQTGKSSPKPKPSSRKPKRF